MLDLTDLPPEVQVLVNDYPIHILEVRRFENYDFFQTDLKLVFGFLQRTQDDEALITYIRENKLEFSNISEDTFDLIGEFSYTRQLNMIKEECKTAETGGYDMCKAIDDMIRKSEERGITQGITQGMEQGIKALVESFQELGVSMEQTSIKVREKFMLEDDMVKNYMEKFWYKV